MCSSLRLLRRSPGFSLVAVICIALGVGVTTTMFSAVNGILVRALPFLRGGELVTIRAQNRKRDVHGSFITWADYAAWGDRNRSFAELGIWATGFPTLSDDSGVDRVEGAVVSASVFSILGVPPAVGRTFTAIEEQAGHDDVAMLSYAIWRGRYGGNQAIVGRAITINSRPHVVIGIMPPGFDFPDRSQVWTLPALQPGWEHDHSRNGLVGIGRLRPGVTLAAAGRDLAAISRELEAAFPENRGWESETMSLRDDLVGALRKPILILLSAAGFVLLIACANVANLMLARGETRRREMAIRAAIGAGRQQIVTQVLTETSFLALLGGGMGAVVAAFGVRMLTLAFPDGVPSYVELSADATVLAFTLFLSLLTGLVFGIVPALRATSIDAAHSLREGARGSAGSALGTRVRDALVVAEVALSLVLMVGATLLIRSDLSLERGLGFDSRGVLTFRVPLPSNYYRTDAQRHAFYEQLAERIYALRGVEMVGSAQGIPFGPLGGSYDRMVTVVEGQPAPRPDEAVPALRLQISTDYLRTLAIPVVRGRSFSTADQDPQSHVAIVNELFARRWFPNRDPVGQRIRFVDDRSATWLTVVGVTRNVRQDRPPRPIEPAVYIPFTFGAQTTVVRTSLADPMTLARDVRATVRGMDPRLPMYLVQSLDHAVAGALWRQRLQAQVFGVFASLALLLASIGIYAVISYAVAQRTRELGVRMALGATRGQVMALVLSHSARLALIGVAIGVVAGALALTRVLAGLLYEVRPSDPTTFVGVSLVLGLVAMLATVTPARRAARVDPLIAIRAE